MNYGRGICIVQPYSRLGAIAAVFGLAFTLSFGSFAYAQAIDEAYRSYADGEFLRAADIGETQNTSEGFALASKALNVHIKYVVGEEGNETLIERSMMLVQIAIEADPTNAEAYLQWTKAVGRHIQTISRIKAASGGYAKKTPRHWKLLWKLTRNLCLRCLAWVAGMWALSHEWARW